jgi:hypothetical protein
VFLFKFVLLNLLFLLKKKIFSGFGLCVLKKQISSIDSRGQTSVSERFNFNRSSRAINFNFVFHQQ